MLELPTRQYCVGCAACFDSCPQNAITMVADREGFLYPRVDDRACVGCGVCTRVCPFLNQTESREPRAVYAVQAKNERLRLDSSSGGVFTLLARQVLLKGGMVFGAAFDETDWSVFHIGVSEEDGLSKLRGSKYVQSRTAGVYRSVKEALGKNLPVLFSGTPCQIAALRRFIGRDDRNLFLVDVVCHGVPSPLVWRRYLQYREVERVEGRDYGSNEGWRIGSISSRLKDQGWKRYSLSIRFVNGQECRKVFSEDPFMRAFLAELCNRPSCHDCRFRGLRSGADLTIGDFWGIDQVCPEMDDDHGTSLVIVNTDKGVSFFERVRSEVDCVASTFDEAVRGNSALVVSPRPHRNRNRFLKGCSPKEFEGFVVRMLRPTFTIQARMCVGRVLRRMGVRR